jgi:hypothetical protein
MSGRGNLKWFLRTYAALNTFRIVPHRCYIVPHRSASLPHTFKPSRSPASRLCKGGGYVCIPRRKKPVLGLPGDFLEDCHKN